MKKIIYEIEQNQYFLLFILLFAYAQSIQIRFFAQRQFDWYIFTPEAAIATFISACILFFIMRFLIKRWQKSDTFSLKETLKIFTISLLLFLVIMNTFGLILALVFDTFERNFNHETLILSIMSDLMDAFIYGSFFLAYYYYQKNKKSQKQMALYNRALSESKTSQLKTQLNPHFLFNNLNILDQLIEEDKQKASCFLTDFSEIYRYVLQTSEKKLVALEEELSFAKSYFEIMHHKYDTSYQLELTEKTNPQGFIPPLTLQLLLENAIEHNLGTPSNPVCITIETGEKLIVSNTIAKKKSTKPTSGRALKNLKEQYRLLSDEELVITHNSIIFSVILPIIPTQKI